MTLSAADLAYMRYAQADLMPEREASIFDVTTARGAGGGLAESWTQRAGTVSVRVSPASSTQVALVADRLKGNDAHTVTLPALTPIKYRDKITLASGRTFVVLAVLDREAWETARQVITMESP